MRDDVLSRRRLAGGLLGLALLASGGLLTLGSWHAARAEPSADAARALIEGVGKDVLAVLRDDRASAGAKLDRLVTLLSGPIDLDLVARLILGRHWRTASAAQQEEYLELFRAFALHTLASRLDVYGARTSRSPAPRWSAATTRWCRPGLSATGRRSRSTGGCASAPTTAWSRST